VLAADGSLYTDNLRTARATDEFITAGGPEVLEPRFTLHGFRYAEITGYPGDID
jgi:alpha-L-rhamnosidase